MGNLGCIDPRDDLVNYSMIWVTEHTNPMMRLGLHGKINGVGNCVGEIGNWECSGDTAVLC